MSVSRRAFLSGRFRAAGGEIRPPWAVGAQEFVSRCDRCGDCAAACPTRVVTSGAGGFPKLDFSAGECSFCAACVQVCTSGALAGGATAPPWRLKAAIGGGCLAARGVECRVCGECCDAGAIRFRLQRGGVARPELEPARCTGCGACFAPCPVRAIAMEMHQ
jgi:ferredoxin-type protein NapF